MSAGLWLFTRIGDRRSSSARVGMRRDAFARPDFSSPANIVADPMTFRSAIVGIAGTHLGLLKFLFLAAIASFVLCLIDPGPPLLFDLPRTLEPVRKFGIHLWNGKNGVYVPPPPPNYGTWFWGEAALLYIGLFAAYVVLGVPTILHTAIRAALDARARRGMRVGPPGQAGRGAVAELVLVATATFIGSVLAQMWGKRQADDPVK